MTPKPKSVQASASGRPRVRLKTSVKSVDVDMYIWFYVERNALHIVHECRDQIGNYIQTDQFRIPLSKIPLASVNQ